MKCPIVYEMWVDINDPFEFCLNKNGCLILFKNADAAPSFIDKISCDNDKLQVADISVDRYIYDTLPNLADSAYSLSKSENKQYNIFIVKKRILPGIVEIGFIGCPAYGKNYSTMYQDIVDYHFLKKNKNTHV